MHTFMQKDVHDLSEKVVKKIQLLEVKNIAGYMPRGNQNVYTPGSSYFWMGGYLHVLKCYLLYCFVVKRML